MRGATRVGFGSVLVMALFVAGLAVAPGAGAQTDSVVINEILYKPVDPGDAEFIELHNTSGDAVDLTGWTLEDAVGQTATLSGTLAANGYGLVTQAGFDAATEWPGVTLFGSYTGTLSGSEDTIIVKDSGGAVVDQLTYLDSAPWPGEPDAGDGASLELIDPLSENSLGGSWAGTATVNTPGLVNSATVAPPADAIVNVAATPSSPTNAQDVTVTATVPGGGAAPMLYWVVGFGSETAVTMSSAGGDVFSATIPDQDDGDLIRYRIEASTDAVYPEGDARRYDGVVVTDPAELPTDLVKMEWFIPEVDYDSMFDDPTIEVAVAGSVLAIDGVVYDNMDVKIRGGGFARENFDKQGLSFDMPSGVELFRPDMVSYPIDEFALTADRGSNFGRPLTSWKLFEEAGFPVVPAQHVRVQRNGEFYGIFRFSEKLDGTWRSNAGIDGGFYKAEGSAFAIPSQFEKKQPDDNDNQPIIDFAAILDLAAGSSKTDQLYATVDIPNAVNYLAVAYIIGHTDSGSNNFYMHEDTERTGLWQIYPWDLSNTFGFNAPNCPGQDIATTDLACVGNPFYDAIRAVPDLEEMVWRRIRTLTDGPAADGVLEALFDAYALTVSSDEKSEDDDVWVTGAGQYLTPAELDEQIDQRRNWMLGNALIPLSQPALPSVVMTELTHSPVNDVEFLELHNRSASSVDMSGWTVDGADLTLPGGSVLLAGDYLVATDSIVAFQAAYPQVDDVVLVQFDGGLRGAGELLELRTAGGALVDSVDYTSAYPWPAEPADGLVSLSMFDPAADNTLPASWGVSVASGGTPGRVNDTVASQTEPPPITEMCNGFLATTTGLVGTPGNDVIVGTSGPDVIDGGGGDDVICGRGGADVIIGGAGDDLINAGWGSDVVRAGDGNDVVFAGPGLDNVEGGAGNDLIRGGRGGDRIVGNGGNDTLYGGDRKDRVFGYSGNDELYGGTGDDNLRGGAGVDSAFGGPGADLCVTMEQTTSC